MTRAGELTGATRRADEEGMVAPERMVRAADLSQDGVYRYSLQRAWGTGGPVAVFVMLNPSTADACTDDPTIRRCIGFARAWGCSGLHVANLYALRTPRPTALWTHPDPVGPENDAALTRLLEHATGPLVAAWGAHARPERAQQVAALAAGRLTCLGVTKSGAPRHPLYVRADTPLIPWNPA